MSTRSRWNLPTAISLEEETSGPPLREQSADALTALAQPPAGEVDVINWRTAEQHETAAQMEPLREFVDWLIATYNVQPSVIPPCWWKHPALIQELYALRVFHAMAFHVEDPGQGPIGFQERWFMARSRLNEYTNDTGCSGSVHAQRVIEPPGPTRIDDEWFELTTGSRAWNDTTTPDEGFQL
ncbi:hypothetical protein HF995_13460 [Sanguibacter hominis ATCC BAA-789]|uniref:DUF4913 domain-containing protein n=1 Tax=Sanguibacter hominis ATCC BAA-789 TaxID=1312740 RepID=A0A9X5ISM0_9MICO|nr:hypothetical protein [Sanguibacter hominis]NKX94264.1 hypothetical protein [Sanguibacter hominis ATCC BAA-789]